MFHLPAETGGGAGLDEGGVEDAVIVRRTAAGAHDRRL